MGLRGWLVIVSAGAILALTMGLRQSMGLYLAPVTGAIGAGRDVFALSMGLMNLVWGMAAPFAGALADRYGAAPVSVAGALLYAAGLFWMTTGGEGAQVLAAGVLIGFGLSGAGFTVVLGAVARAMPESRRSAALALVATGGSVGQLAALPLAHLSIQQAGWMSSLWILAGCMLLAVPLSVGLATRAVSTATQAAPALRDALGEAVRSRSFWLLNAGFFVCGFQLAFVAVHMPAWLGDLGFGTWLAPAALTVIGATNVVGTWACGVLGGRFPYKDVLTVLYLARGAVFAVLLLVPVSEASVLVFAAAMGFLWLGTVPLTSGVVAGIFGTANVSMLFGFVFLGHQIGGFLGAWLSGAVYEWSGSYDVMWWCCAGLALVAAALHWPIEERPAALAVART